MAEQAEGVRCPRCAGALQLLEGTGSVPDAYNCYSQSCKWEGMRPEKGEPKAAAGPDIRKAGPVSAPPGRAPYSRGRGRSAPPGARALPPAVTPAPSAINKKEKPVEQTQEDLRLTQLNMRRKKKGLPRLNSLQEAIDKGIYHPRGGYTTGHPKQTHRRESLSKPRKGPNLPDSPSPLASSLATPGNGSERDKSLLAGVIVEELDKEIQALVFAKKVIQRRFQHVQTDR